MSRRILILAGVVAALAAFLFLWDLPRERAQEAQEEVERRLLEFNPATVDTLRIVRPDHSVVLAKGRAGEWWLLDPIEVVADSHSVEKHLSLLAQAARERVIVEDATSSMLEEYGLAGPESGTAVIEVVFGGGRSDRLLVGILSPGERAVYVRRNESPMVELADLQVFNTARIRHHVFRDHDLFALAESSIVAVDVKAGDVRYAVHRGRQGLWYLDEPDGRRLKHIMMKNFVYDLAVARVREFIQDGLSEDDWKAYGLHDPLADVTFITDDGSTRRIRSGNEDKERLVFGRRDEEGTVFLMPPQILKTAEIPLSQLLDYNPIDENFDRLDSLRVTWENGATLAAVRGEDAWATRPLLEEGKRREIFVPLKNVLYGVERFTADATMLLARGNEPRDVLDEMPVSCDLYWPHTQLRLWVGWRKGEENHWVYIEGENQLRAIERDLFFRFRSFLMVAGRLTP